MRFPNWFFAVGLALMGFQAIPLVAEPRPLSPDHVARQVLSVQPKPAELRWTRIGWQTSLVEGRRLAALHRRPAFVFFVDGRLELGLC